MEIQTTIFWTIILIILSIIDISLTYKSVIKFRKIKIDKFKDVEEEDLELTPLVKFFWNKIGFKNTRNLYFLLVIVFYSLFSIFLYNYANYFMLGYIGFFIGCYTIIIRIHLSNLKYFKEQEVKQKARRVKHGIHPKPKVLGILPNFI